MREQLASASEVLARARRSRARLGRQAHAPGAARCSRPSCAATPARAAIHVAAAVELLHTATLLHDDVVDLSELRRGRPSANALWGNRRAVLVGRLLLRARLVADRRGRRSRHPVDLRRHDPPHGRGRAAPAPAQLRPVGHRGALLRGDRAQERGAAVARRASRARSSAASRAPSGAGSREYGRELGLAFQLRDDALDYEDREADLGKRPLRRPARGQGDAAAPARAEALHGGRARGGGVAAQERCRAARADPDGRRRARLDLAPAIEVVRRYRGVEDTVAPRRKSTRAARAPRSLPSPMEAPRATCSPLPSSRSSATARRSRFRLAPHRSREILPCIDSRSTAGAALALALALPLHSRARPRSPSDGDHRRREREHRERRGARDAAGHRRRRARRR